MSAATLRVKAISGHAVPVPGQGAQRQEQVAKLIDTTTCIGCKACEVACLEWNDLPFRETVFQNSYQTMPQTAWNYWNLIKFDEHPREDGTMQWRKLGAVAALSCVGSPVAWHFRQGAAFEVKSSLAICVS